MIDTLSQIQALVRAGDVEVSRHGLLELAADNISLGAVIASIDRAVTVEDYPDAQRGPSVLALQRDDAGNGHHVLWGIPKNASGPAVLITAYRPDPKRWSDDLKRRKR